MKTYRYSALLLAFVALALPVVAEAQARIARTEFLTYDKREDAKRDIRTNIDKHIAFRPAV